MNEWLFLLHIGIIAALSLFLIRFGKEGAIAYLSLLAFSSNLFLLKQIDIFGLHVCASDAFAIGYLFTFNLIQEFFDTQSAKRAALITSLLGVLFLLFSAIHLSYKPSADDSLHHHFSILLRPMPRIIFSSLISFFIVQWADISLFSYLKKRFASRYFAARVLICLLLAEILDTVLFSVLALTGEVSHLLDILFFSTLIKALGALVTLPFCALAKRVHLPSR